MEIKTFWRDIIGVTEKHLLEEAAQYSIIRSLHRKEIVIREHERLTEIPFLMSGVVKSYCLDAEGREKIFCFGYQPGDPVTSIYSLDREIRSVCTIEVIRDAVLLCIPLGEMNRLVSGSLEAARIYEGLLSQSLQKTVERDHVLASCTARQRYEWFIRFYPGLDEQISKKDIASYLNMSSENLSRIIKVM